MCISRSHWPSNYGDVNKSNSNGDSKLYTALLVFLVEVHNFCIFVLMILYFYLFFSLDCLPLVTVVLVTPFANI